MASTAGTGNGEGDAETETVFEELSSPRSEASGEERGELSDEVRNAIAAGELTDLLDQTYGLMAAAERRFVEAIAVFSEMEGYRLDGARSMSDWLCERYSMARGRAGGFVSVAEGLRGLPFLAASYEEGALSLDQLRPLVSVADESVDEALAAEAPGLTAAQCNLLAGRLRRIGREESNEVHRKRFLRFFHRRDRFVLKGELSTEEGAVIEQAISQLAASAPKNEETGNFEPYEQRAADALVELCSGALGELQEKEADVATVVCHVDPLTAAGLEGGEAELDGARQIAGETARRLMCDCRFQMLKENANGEVIGLGRTTRVIPTWLRRMLRLRDGGCRFPGCARTSWVDRHHIIHWADGGATDACNLVQICRSHHRVVHEQGWVITGDPSGELSFTSPSGRVVTSRPAPPRRDILERFGLWQEDEGGRGGAQDGGGEHGGGGGETVGAGQDGDSDGRGGNPDSRDTPTSREPSPDTGSG